MQSKLAPNPVMLRRTESCAALRAAASLCRTQLNSPREHVAAGNSSIAQIPNRTRGNKPSTSDSLDAEREQCDKRSVGSGRVLTTSSLQVWVQIAFCKSCTNRGPYGDAVPAGSNSETTPDPAPAVLVGAELDAGVAVIPGSSSSLSILLIFSLAKRSLLSCKVPSSSRGLFTRAWDNT